MTSRPGEDKPGEDKPGEDKPGEDKPGEDKPGNEGGRSGRESIANLTFGSIGALSALCGPVVAIIAIFEWSSYSKIFWSVVLTIAATLVAGSLFALFRTFARSAAIALIISVLIYVGITVGVSMEYQRVVDQADPSCIAPGAGGGPYTTAFREAFARAGAEDVFACGVSPVVPISGGMHQNFTTPDGQPAVIFAVEPGSAVGLDSDAWIGYHSIRSPVETTAYAGFPYAEPQLLANGKKMEVGAGPGNWQRSGVVKRKDRTWFWVQAGIWSCYNNQFGGPEGQLGYPIADEEYDVRLRLPFRRFERGTLYDDPTRGVLTENELGPTTSVGCKGPEQLVFKDIYRVEATPAGVAHEILPDGEGYVEQSFTATAGTINDLAVTVGLDPLSNSGGIHPLSMGVALLE